MQDLAASAEDWQINKEFSLLGLSDDTLYKPFNLLSMGEQTKALLASLFLNDNHFLLIDEPTNHLDANSRSIVANYLKNKKGFILVSHDRAFLDSCIDHVLSINKENIEIIKGNFSTWHTQKQNQDNFELNQNQKLTRQIDRLNVAAQKTSNWANKSEGAKIGIDPNKVDNKMGFRANQGAKSKKMMSQSKAIVGRIENDIVKKESLLKNIESSFDLKLSPLIFNSNTLLELKDIGISYDDKQILNNFNLTINNGDRIALSGGNGSGKSSIIKLILGQNIKHTGTVYLPTRLKISYVSQDSSHLTGGLKDFAIKNELDETLFRAILNKLDFNKAQFDIDTQHYSQGQKKKVLLASSLASKAHLYIWDEPLNYIDILSRIQIENLILNYTPTLLFVEHDAMFTDNVATSVIKL